MKICGVNEIKSTKSLKKKTFYIFGDTIDIAYDKKLKEKEQDGLLKNSS